MTSPPPGTTELIRIPTSRLVIGPHHQPTIAWARITAWATVLKATRLEPTPIEVAPFTDTAGCRWWLVRNGRHRYLAALIAGRTDILATTEQP